MGNFTTNTSHKSRKTALILCIFFGYFGAHKFYEGKIGMGVLYLFTFGLFGIGWIAEIVTIIYRKEKPQEPFAYKEQMEKSQFQNHFESMDGWQFEKFCAEVLKNIGYENVEVTKGSGDQGVDILAERDGVRYAVQCKYYSGKVGNKAVQEINAGKMFYHCHVGVVMTNDYFTQSAKDLAREV